MNFPMQANGAEMMRLAAIAATETGIEVCCPVHDAFVISAPIDRLENDVAAIREIMSRAGRLVTGGLDVRTSIKVARWPDRYMDSRGEDMWDRVIGLMERGITGDTDPTIHGNRQAVLTCDRHISENPNTRVSHQ